MPADSNLTEALRAFKFERILSSNSQQKTVALLGSIDSQPAILTLERLHYDTDILSNSSTALSTTADNNNNLSQIIDITNINLLGHNDIYRWFTTLSAQSLPHNPSNKLNLIYPATAKHIKKYQSQKLHIVKETPQLYADIVEPYIKSMQGDRIQWVRNILYHGAELENVLYRDSDKENGFVLLPDMKWDGKTIESLYVCCIVNRLDVASIRDLNWPQHGEWLKWLQEQIETVVAEKIYKGKVARDELRIFVHYQPSYYHFHVHVVNVMHEGLGNGISAGKAILLLDVIEDLKLLGDEGFKKKSLSYLVGEQSDLWGLFKENGVV